MLLELSFMNEHDLEEWVTTDFKSLKSRRHCVLWSAEPSSSSISQLVELRRQSLASDPTVRYLKVTDTDTGELIACAKWNLYLSERSEAELERARRICQLIPEQDTPAMAEILDLVHEQRRNCMGTRPHLLLSNLVTRPAHRRRGAGSMLIQWGLDYADGKELTVYLEASEETRLLYEKFGFQVFSEFSFNKAKYGGEGVDRYVVSFSRFELPSPMVFREPPPSSQRVS